MTSLVRVRGWADWAIFAVLSTRLNQSLGISFREVKASKISPEPRPHHPHVLPDASWLPENVLVPHPVGCTLICLLPWSHGGSLTSLQTCQIMKQSLYLNAPWFPAVTREGEGRRGSLLEISRWSLEAPPSPEPAQNPCLSLSLIVLADVEKLIFLYQSGFTPFVSKGEDPKLP